ncbi:MAG: NAD(P)H-binding protein, partial [Actinomycetota bacterium]|nr:NAD(P)H-binding protein [Actinomycetota bacterium]
MTAQDTTLVIGATGKTGRRVAERLGAREVPVRAGSRSGDPRFDWEDRSTWGPALDGATSAYVSFYPDLAVPGATDAIAALAEAAIESGTRRLVLLSGRGEEEAQRAEQALEASGVPEWTIVRCSWFSQNFSEGDFLEPVLAGELALPVGAVPEPFVDVEDIADVATAALTEDGHAGRLYELTGPRTLTFEEAVGEIAAAAGRPIRYVQVPLDAWTAEMAAADVPDDVVALMSFLFTEVLDGRNVQLTNGVQEALGREPRDFR